MSTAHVTYTGAIRETAAALGRDPSAEQVSRLNLVLQSLGQIDTETGTVTVATDAGPVPVSAYIAREAATFPKATTSTSTGKTSPSATPARSQADRDADAGILRVGSSVQHGRPRGDGFADIVRAIQAQHDTVLGAEAATWPNPWKPGQVNRTRQVVLQKLDPAKAAQFKTEAAA